ncbi:MAG: hypothetical protein JJT75_02780 [Opitutales bacterium]|nr:hypothetical protein [Opitutales bacterium]
MSKRLFNLLLLFCLVLGASFFAEASPDESRGPDLHYSPSGLLQSATLGGQTIQSFFYGENNHRPDQLTRVQYNDPEDPSAEISLSYDNRERLKTVSDPVGARSYAYHFNGSLKEENHTAGPWADWTLERDPEGDPLFRPRTLRLKDDETTVYSVGRDYLGYSRLL